jgi:hypothetical protein
MSLNALRVIQIEFGTFIITPPFIGLNTALQGLSRELNDARSNSA